MTNAQSQKRAAKRHLRWKMVRVGVLAIGVQEVRVGS